MISGNLPHKKTHTGKENKIEAEKWRKCGDRVNDMYGTDSYAEIPATRFFRYYIFGAVESGIRNALRITHRPTFFGDQHF